MTGRQPVQRFVARAVASPRDRGRRVPCRSDAPGYIPR